MKLTMSMCFTGLTRVNLFLYECMGWDPMAVFKEMATPLHFHHVKHLQHVLGRIRYYLKSTGNAK